MTAKTFGYCGMKPEAFFEELEALEPGVVVYVRENLFRVILLEHEEGTAEDV